MPAGQAEREENEMNNGLWTSVKDNVVFVLVSVGIAAALMLIAYAAEKAIKKRNHDTERVLSTRKIAMIGVFSAIAAVLMLFEFPLPFAPSFYELEFSEIPALVGTFAFGPVAGVMIEFVKILLKLLMKGTSTAFVGDLANFVVGCSFILPASIIYLFKKTRKTALIGSVTGTLIMTVFGTAGCHCADGKCGKWKYQQHCNPGCLCGSAYEPVKGRQCFTGNHADLQEAQPDPEISSHFRKNRACKTGRDCEINEYIQTLVKEYR